MISVAKLVAKRKILTIGFVGFLSLVIIGYVVYGGLFNKANLYRAEVSMVTGNVEKSEVEGTWIELQSNDNVKQGDTVRVNGVGKAIITLDDGSAIRLDDDSSILLASLDPGNIEIINQKGEVYTRVVKADRPFVVKVEDESFRALGTAYKTVNGESEKGVYVYESKVKAISDDVEVAEGKKYLKDSDDSKLVNKITDISSGEISSDDFVLWNKEQDQNNEEFNKFMGVLDDQEKSKEAETKTETKEETKTTTKTDDSEKTTQPAVASITLSASKTDDGVLLKWSTSGLNTSSGFKVVKGTSANPSYPGNSAVYMGSDSNSYEWKISDGETYHFRVCQYTGSGCGTYSNNIQIQAPYKEDGIVNSINLIASSDGVVNWTVDGYSDDGFKVVWSKLEGPTYPTRSTDRYHYFSSPETVTDTLTAFDGAGDYHVRVCEYLGGKCGKYSNEVVVTLE